LGADIIPRFFGKSDRLPEILAGESARTRIEKSGNKETDQKEDSTDAEKASKWGALPKRRLEDRRSGLRAMD
jgi:hypothetical protein